MKHKCKKVLAVLACLALSAGVSACGIFGGDDDKGGTSGSGDTLSTSSGEQNSANEAENLLPTAGITYEQSIDGTYAIVTGYDPSLNDYEKRAVIASTYEGLPVKYIADSAFSNFNYLTEIVIPEGVIHIGNYAFWDCGSLTKITLPDSLESAGYNPFGSNADLQYTVKEGLKYLGNKNNPYIYLDDTESTGITSAIIAEGCKIIGFSVFSGYSELTNVVIPDSVVTIGAHAFKNCTKLEYTIKNGLKYLGNNNNPYIYLAGAETVDIETANIESSCIAIGDYAFENCKSLTQVVIPDGVKSIGWYAFFYCEKLHTVSISRNCALLRIEPKAFYNCDSLKTIVIPDTVMSIGESAFSYCDGLTTIFIPISVTSIGDYAFAFSNSLTIYCEAETKPKGWSSGALSWNHSMRPVVWGYKIEDKEENSSSDGNTSENVEQGTEGLEYIKYASRSYCAVIGYTGTETKVVIPSVYDNLPVKYVSEYAFENCSSLTEVDIPDSVTHIDSYAFRGCSSLTEVVIPASVTSIGSYAFSGCSSLTEVVIPDSVTSIGGGAFSNCSSLTEVVIPDSVTSIGGGAFSNCSSLTEVVIPNSVTGMGIGVFEYCYNLTVYCEAKSKPSGWDRLWNGGTNSFDCPVVWDYTGE